jgi:DNA-binding GntR family transcriptional regulator
VEARPGVSRIGPGVAGVERALWADIVEATLVPGTRLVDAALAERFGVSRNTVREAMRALEGRGLVTNRRNAGYSVRVLTTGDVRDIYQARVLIETAAIEASAHAPDELLDDVIEAVAASARLERAGSWREVGTASLHFHRALVALGRSERVIDFFDSLIAQLRLAFAVMVDEAAFQRQWVDRDREIADAIVSGRRAEARMLLLAYLNDSETQVVDALRRA